MVTNKGFAVRWIAAFSLLALAALSLAVPLTARADGPGTDGSLGTWYNGTGAATVYCVDNADKPSATFSNGGIEVLNARGERVFFADAAELMGAGTDLSAAAAAGTGTAQDNVTANSVTVPQSGMLVAENDIYQLYRTPDGNFQLNSIPDSEGKTFVGAFAANCSKITP